MKKRNASSSPAKLNRDMPRPKLLIVIAAIIYFVSPFDVIPDYLPVLGVRD